MFSNTWVLLKDYLQIIVSFVGFYPFSHSSNTTTDLTGNWKLPTSNPKMVVKKVVSFDDADRVIYYYMIPINYLITYDITMLNYALITKFQ